MRCLKNLKITGLGKVENRKIVSNVKTCNIYIMETVPVGEQGHKHHLFYRKAWRTGGIEKREATQHPCTVNPRGSEQFISAVFISHKSVTTPGAAEVCEWSCSSCFEPFTCPGPCWGRFWSPRVTWCGEGSLQHWVGAQILGWSRCQNTAWI